MIDSNSPRSSIMSELCTLESWDTDATRAPGICLNKDSQVKSEITTVKLTVPRHCRSRVSEKERTNRSYKLLLYPSNLSSSCVLQRVVRNHKTVTLARPTNIKFILIFITFPLPSFLQKIESSLDTVARGLSVVMYRLSNPGIELSYFEHRGRRLSRKGVDWYIVFGVCVEEVLKRDK